MYYLLFTDYAVPAAVGALPPTPVACCLALIVVEHPAKCLFTLFYLLKRIHSDDIYFDLRAQSE